MCDTAGASGPDGRGIATLAVRGTTSVNVIGSPVIAEVSAALDVLAPDPRLRVLVLRGGDTTFVGGADIGEMALLDPDTARAFIGGLAGLCERLRAFPVPVIARLAGWCLGAGLEVAAACDLRISSDRARFGMPEVAVGIPSVVHAALLPRLVGAARAHHLILTGEPVTAGTALDWGLVTAVVPQDGLDAEIARLAGVLAGYGPAVLRQQKRLLRYWEDVPLDAAVDASVEEFAAAFRTGEPQAAMRAFLDRERRPRGGR